MRDPVPTPPTPDHDGNVPLLTPREAARILAVSPRKLWSLTASLAAVGHSIPACLSRSSLRVGPRPDSDFVGRRCHARASDPAAPATSTPLPP